MARSVRQSSPAFHLGRLLARTGVAAAALAAVGAAATGCAPGNPGIVVVNQLAPTDECIWDPSTNVFIGEPVLDVDPLTPPLLASFGLAETRPTYIGQLLILNNLINRYSVSYPVMADPNFVNITGAEVELLDNAGRRLPNGFYRTRASGTIPSALGDQPGRGVARVDVIPRTVAASLADSFIDRLEGEGLVTARVVVIGQSQGGTEVRSLPFVMPISLCYGCLYIDAIPDEGETRGCTPGQDFAFLAPGFTRTQACVDSSECASGVCVLGHCGRDPV